MKQTKKSKQKILTCRKCGSACTTAKKGNMIRYFNGKKPLRACQSCGNIFHVKWTVSPQTLLVFTVAILAGMIAINNFTKGGHLTTAVKKSTVYVYKKIYGETHKQKLRDHWNWIYHDNKTRNRDYDMYEK